MLGLSLKDSLKLHFSIYLIYRYVQAAFFFITVTDWIYIWVSSKHRGMIPKAPRAIVSLNSTLFFSRGFLRLVSIGLLNYNYQMKTKMIIIMKIIIIHIKHDYYYTFQKKRIDYFNWKIPQCPLVLIHMIWYY